MKTRLVSLLGLFITAGILGLMFGQQTTVSGVYTHSGDEARTGRYQSNITVAGLEKNGVRRITTIPVYGDARGTEAQPLIIPRVAFAQFNYDHDVMIVPTMANYVNAVDAHTGAQLWRTQLNQHGMAINGSRTIDDAYINQHWGVLNTPVADPSTRRIYIVDWESPDGSPQKGVHYMYTLDAGNGKILEPPVSFAALSGYSQVMRKMRCSLSFITVDGHKTVFGAWGTIYETGHEASGAIFAFDTATNRFTAFLSMSNGRGAGIWLSGQGLNADSQGNLYGVTGNGSFNGTTDLGEAMFEVHYTPPASSTTMGALKIVGEFSPYSDAGRMGLDPTHSDVVSAMPMNKLSGVFQLDKDMMKHPVNEAMNKDLKGAKAVVDIDQNTGAPVVRLYPVTPTQDAAWDDEDLGAAGCAFIEQYHLLACGGKDGILYAVNTQNWPNTKPTDFANMHGNCLKLAAWPIWATASPGKVDPCPQDLTTLNFLPWGKTRHMHSTPVQFWAPDGTLYLFLAGENSAVHKWRVTPRDTSGHYNLTYVAEGKEFASVADTNPPGGMPGAFCSLGTADPTSTHPAPGTSVLWCSFPYGNANAEVTWGRLVAYDPENLAAPGPDGISHLKVLWDSERWGIPFQFNKFMPPVLFQDEVILPNYNGGVELFR